MEGIRISLMIFNAVVSCEDFMSFHVLQNMRVMRLCLNVSMYMKSVEAIPISLYPNQFTSAGVIRPFPYHIASSPFTCLSITRFSKDPSSMDIGQLMVISAYLSTYLQAYACVILGSARPSPILAETGLFWQSDFNNSCENSIMFLILEVEH